MKNLLTDSNIDGVIVAWKWARWVSTSSPATIRCFNGGVWCHEQCASSADTIILGGGRFCWFIIMLFYCFIII